MPGYIDFHTHAFPDQIAARAVPALEKEGNTKAFLDGTIKSLLQSMDRAGIERSVLCSIATRPEQFDAILTWSAAIRSPRIIPLPSIHPADPEWDEHLRMIQEEGFAGIKMHPYYQDFFLADTGLSPFFEKVCEYGLLLVMHTGYDIAFPRIKRCDPLQILTLIDRFPYLKLITTHCGAWDDWQDVRDLLIGKQIHMDISFSLDHLGPEKSRELICAHPPEYLLFGSDSPWADQAEALNALLKLGLNDALFQRIVHDNGAALLGCSL